MPRIPLLSGAYTARGIIANAQRCVNLYPEDTQEPTSYFTRRGDTNAPTPVTHYQCPGTVLLTQVADSGWRCLYTASNGQLFGVCGNSVYYIPPGFTTPQFLGTISSPVKGAPPLCSMTDNGIQALLVDGSSSGYAIILTNPSAGGNPTMMTLNPTDNGDTLGYGFVGGGLVDEVDTFVIGTIPGTAQFFSSLSNELIFEPLQVAAKAGWPDLLVGLVVAQRQIWLIGTQTTEIWFNAGGATFPFQIQSTTYVEHGCLAPSSIVKVGEDVMWLSVDRRGQVVCIRSVNGNSVKKVSTHAIENEWMTYTDLAGAVAFSYQQEGHTFYRITFPGDDKSWGYDISTDQWFEPLWMDANGLLHRHRAQCGAFAYNTNVVGDWENGNLYQLNLNVFSDNGMPMHYIRSMPHLIDNDERIVYPSLIADMQTGTQPQVPLPDVGQYCSTAIVETSPVTMATSDKLTGVSPFHTFVFVGWFYLPDDSTVHGVWFGNQTSDSSPGNGGLQLGIFNDQSGSAGKQIVLKAYDSSNSLIVSAAFPWTAWGSFVTFYMSVDTANHVCQLWANDNAHGDVAVTPSLLVWSSTNAIDNPSGHTWHLTPSGGP